MTIKRVILDYEAGELILQVKAAHAAIREGRPVGGISCSVYDFEGRGRRAFGVKWNKDSVRVYPQDRS